MDLDVFRKAVLESKLVAADILDNAIARFMYGDRAPGSRGSDLEALGDYLVFERLMTFWQFLALLHGRRNFHFSNFRLLEQVRDGREKWAYLAENMTTKKTVKLSITWPLKWPTDDTATIYAWSADEVSVPEISIIDENGNRPLPDFDI
ncbi:MAG TPA: hypothetical protein VHD36_23600 [Pirellulales bacterium]|nr:hypothetical protein [Pirellulales bacterium]